MNWNGGTPDVHYSLAVFARSSNDTMTQGILQPKTGFERNLAHRTEKSTFSVAAMQQCSNDKGGITLENSSDIMSAFKG